MAGRKKSNLIAKRLELSEVKYRELFDSIKVCVIVLKPKDDGEDFVIKDINAATEQVERVRLGEVVGKNVIAAFPGVRESGILDIFNRVWKTGEPERFPAREFKNKRVKGWREGYIYRLPSEDIVAVYEDVTERKLAELRQKEIEELFSAAFNYSPDAMAIAEYETGKTILVNSAFQKQSGYSAADIIGKTAIDMNLWVHPEERDRIMRQVDEEGQVADVEIQFRPKSGQIRDALFSARHVETGGKQYLFSSTHDVTDRNLMEKALRESEEHYRLLADHTADFVWLLDMNLYPTYQNPSAEKLTGFTYEDLAELPLEKRLTPESLKLATEAVFKEMPKVQNDPAYNPILELELEIYRKDGTTLWVESKFSFIRDRNGQPAAMLGEARDITQRRKAQKLLKESEQKYRSLITQSPDSIFIVGLKGAFLAVNRAMCEFLKYNEEELLSMNIWDIFPEQYIDQHKKRIEDILRGRASNEAAEYLVRGKDGNQHYVEILSAPYYQGEKLIGFQGIARNITERKKTEEDLKKSYESLKRTLNDAINNMVKIVEMRDPYTSGHQQRVADLACAIAGEMKLENVRIEQLRMAAIIHDIGKIFVPSDILSKPGKLTDLEFRLVKTHAQHGYDIVKGMEIPGAIAQAILQHHERLDGSGYPNQLKGEDMLLEAKILAVADVIEAMFSHRPFRPALGIEKALEEISKNRGKLYDPDVVDACLYLFESGKYQIKPV